MTYAKLGDICERCRRPFAPPTVTRPKYDSAFCWVGHQIVPEGYGALDWKDFNRTMISYCAVESFKRPKIGAGFKPKPPVTCDGCGGEYPRHLHYCLDCMAKAVPNLAMKLFWKLMKRFAGGGATCPNCKTPFFLSKAHGTWGL